jgi:hypothetical protein
MKVELLLFWVIWTIFHLFLISTIESLIGKIAPVIFYIWISIGIIALWKANNETTKEM